MNNILGLDTGQDSLISGLLAEERESIELLIRLHQPWMLALARRILNDEHLAEDCVQESLITTMREIGSLQEQATFKAWLRRITVNNCLMKLRQLKRRNESSIDDLMPAIDRNECRIEPAWSVIETPESLLQQQENAAQVHKIIHQLPDDYRIVLLLRDIEELSTKEVASLLECNEGTVKVRLHRARSALKKLLEPMMCREEKR